MRLCCILLLLSHFLVAQPELELLEVASGFSSPVAMSNAGDGSGRLFVVERSGIIKIIDDIGEGSVVSTPFLDIRNKVRSGGERGLLGLAFHPNFPTSPYFYVNYTFQELGQLKTRIERYTVSTDPNIADLNSGLTILTFDQPYSNHNGGDVKFGPDGYLYIAIGDGGSAFDPDDESQEPTSLLGSLLRIDVNGDDFPSDPLLNYAIPNDNPFLSLSNYRDEFWAIGLRNPWRISFDKLTGDLWIADVGQGDREEVNHQSSSSAGGQNYGWSCKEGTLLQNFNDCLPGTLTEPVFEYGRTEGYSITGGFVYRGSVFDNLIGKYIVTDYGTGNFWLINSLNFNDFQKVSSLLSSVSTFGESESGELYVAQLFNGRVYRVIDASICKDDIVIQNHDDGTYYADGMLSSSVQVTTQDSVTYVSPNINLSDPFLVDNQAQFTAESRTCRDKLRADSN